MELLPNEARWTVGRADTLRGGGGSGVFLLDCGVQRLVHIHMAMSNRQLDARILSSGKWFEPGIITLVEITKKKAEGRAKPGPRHFNVNLSERERKKRGPPKRNSKGKPVKGEKMQRG